MNCPTCNAILPISAKFCRKCGARINNEETNSNHHLVVCPKCGTHNHIDAKYCRYDGYNLQKSEDFYVHVQIKEYFVVCPKCGDRYLKGVKFCRRDGTKLEFEGIDENISSTTDSILEKNFSDTIHNYFDETETETGNKAKSDITEDESITLVNNPDLTSTKICPKCGTENYLNAKFCRLDVFNFQNYDDGDHDKSNFTSKQSSFVVCSECGSTYVEGTKFCRNDGTELRYKTDHSDFQVTEKQIYKQENEDVIIHQELVDVQDNKQEAVNTPSEPISNVNIGISENENKRTIILNKRYFVYALIICAILLGFGGIYLINTFILSNQDEVVLIINNELRNNSFNVTCIIDKDWIATLKGTTKSRTDKLKAIEIANSHKEVRFTKSEIVSLLSPSEMKTQIDNALISAGIIEVNSEVDDNHYVSLKGFANSITEKIKAVQIASEKANTKYVTDSILINNSLSSSHHSSKTDSITNNRELITDLDKQKYSPGTERESLRLQKSLNQALRYAGLNGVSAAIGDNYVTTLKGSVTSEREKMRAFNIARSFVKIKVLRDKIFVVQ